MEKNKEVLEKKAKKYRKNRRLESAFLISADDLRKIGGDYKEHENAQQYRNITVKLKKAQEKGLNQIIVDKEEIEGKLKSDLRYECKYVINKIHDKKRKFNIFKKKKPVRYLISW
jgi:hypothetical protein